MFEFNGVKAREDMMISECRRFQGIVHTNAGKSENPF